MPTSAPKKILITFGRSFLALELARQLHAAGHTVYVADSMRYYVTRFSNAVEKHYRVPSPRTNHIAYINALIHIVKHEKIDFLLPIYEEITHLSRAQHRFPKFCKLFCPSFEQYEELHNKWSFHCLMQKLKIDTAKAFQVKTFDQIQNLDFTTPFALKACYSRASQTVKKVYPKQTPKPFEIEEHNPWIAQEWLEGSKFCTYSICHEGKLYAHATYPVHYAIEGNSCLTFTSIDHPGIVKWIENFVQKTRFTGQIAFDFIETHEKKLYAIECNPRATSGVLLFTPEMRIDRAFFQKNTSTIFPHPDAKQQIATGMLLYGWRKSSLPNNNLFKFIKTFCSIKDVVFRSRDLKPFIFEPLVFGSILKNSLKHKLSLSASFTHDHDWNGEDHS